MLYVAFYFIKPRLIILMVTSFIIKYLLAKFQNYNNNQLNNIFLYFKLTISNIRLKLF